MAASLSVDSQQNDKDKLLISEDGKEKTDTEATNAVKVRTGDESDTTDSEESDDEEERKDVNVNDDLVPKVRTGEESDTTDSEETEEEEEEEEREDDEDEVLNEQLAFANVGMLSVLTGDGMSKQKSLVSRLADKELGQGCVSPTSSCTDQDVFFECLSNSDLHDDDTSTVVTEEKSLTDQLAEMELQDQLVQDILNGGVEDLEEKVSKRYMKNVPMDPSETWDFSLQALDKDYKSKGLLLEGSFFPSFVEECLHEMQNVACQCDNKVKMPVCRLCKAVFCSKQCFKRTIKTLTGEENCNAVEQVNEESDKPVEEEKINGPEESPAMNSLKDNGYGQSQMKPGFSGASSVEPKSYPSPRNKLFVLPKNQNSRPSFHNKFPNGDNGVPWSTGIKESPLPGSNSAGFVNQRRDFTTANKTSWNSHNDRRSGEVPTKRHSSPVKDPIVKVSRNPRAPILSSTDEPPSHFFTRNKQNPSSSHFQNRRPPQLPEPKVDNHIVSSNNSDPVGVKSTDQPNTERAILKANGSGKDQVTTEQDSQKAKVANQPNTKQESKGNDQPKTELDNPKGIDNRPDTVRKNSYGKKFEAGPQRQRQLSSDSSRSRTHSWSNGSDQYPGPLSYSGSKFNRLPEEDKLISFDVPYNVLMPVKYIYGKDFSNFSVVPAWRLDRFMKLHAELQACPKFKLETYVYGGQYLVKYHWITGSEEWYRAITIAKMPRRNRTVVYLGDLGVKTEINIDALHTCPPGLFQIEQPFAFLARCVNVKGNMNDENVIEQFKSLVQEPLFVKMRITHADKTEQLKFVCHLEVMYMNKWFDAGVLLQKLEVCENLTPEDIKQEEKMQKIFKFKSTILRNESLPTGNHILVEVTHVNSPNDFYVSTSNSRKSLSLLQNILYHSQLDRKAPVRALMHLNHAMFMWVGNEEWPRVKIVELAHQTPMNGLCALVQKVDTGEVVVAPIGELIQLPREYFTPSSCAYRCSLPVKLPAKGRNQKEPVFAELTNILQGLKNTPRRISMDIFSVEPSSNLHVVDLSFEGTKSLLSDFLDKGLLKC